MSQPLKVVSTKKFEVLALPSEKDFVQEQTTVAENQKSTSSTSTSMSTKEELGQKIAELGEAIKQAKADKKPKEEWDPILQEMLAAKVGPLQH